MEIVSLFPKFCNVLSLYPRSGELNEVYQQKQLKSFDFPVSSDTEDRV